MADGSVKLGFRAHYPQLETKITIRGADMAEVNRKLAPIQAEVRKRLGNFIMAEDDQTLEGVLLAELLRQNATLTLVETFTGGQMAARFSSLPGAEHVFRRAIVARDRHQLFDAIGLTHFSAADALSQEIIEQAAMVARHQSGATHALAVLIDLDEGADRMDFGGTIWIGIATADEVVYRRAHILGGREWVRLGAVELGLDCLRRYLQGVPVVERIDVEKA